MWRSTPHYQTKLERSFMKSTFNPIIAQVVEFSIMGKGPFRAVIGHRTNLSRRINSLLRNLASDRKPQDRTHLNKIRTSARDAELNIPRTAYELSHLGPCDITSISKIANVTARDLHKSVREVVKHNDEVADSIDNFATWYYELATRKATTPPVVWEKDHVLEGEHNTTQEALVTIDMGPVLGHQTTVMVLGGRDLRVSSMTEGDKKIICNKAFTRIAHNVIGFLVSGYYRRAASCSSASSYPITDPVVKLQESKKFITKAIELFSDASECQSLVSVIAVDTKPGYNAKSFPSSSTIAIAEPDSLATIVTAVRISLYGK